MNYYIDARARDSFICTTYTNVESAMLQAKKLSLDGFEVSVYSTDGTEETLLALFVRGVDTMKAKRH